MEGKSWFIFTKKKKEKKCIQWMWLTDIRRYNEETRKRQAWLNITPTQAGELKSCVSISEAVLLRSTPDEQTELLGIKHIHYLALEMIIFRARVKVAERAVPGHSAKSQASGCQRQPESAEPRQCGKCVAKVKPIFLQLNKNARQDPQGLWKGMHPWSTVTSIRVQNPKELALHGQFYS